MKKIFISLIASMVAVGSFSQTKINPTEFNNSVADRSFRMYLGPVVGVNYSMLSGNPDNFDIGAKSDIAYQGGLAFSAHFGRKNGVGQGGTGIFGIYAAAKYALHSIKTDGSDKIKLSYMEIPLLAQLFVSKGLSIEAGPTFAIPMSSSPERIDFPNSSTSIMAKDIKGNDCRFTVGARYAANNGFNIAAHYNIGMSDLAGNLPCKMSVIEVSLGWMFNIIK